MVFEFKIFDIEAAKNGAEVCTTDGRSVRILCFDRRGELPIVALVGEKEEIINYTTKGTNPVFENATLVIRLISHKRTAYIFREIDTDVVMAVSGTSKEDAVKNFQHGNIEYLGETSLEWNEVAKK